MYSLESNLLLSPATPPPNIDINELVTEAEMEHANCAFNCGSKSWSIDVPFFGFFTCSVVFIGVACTVFLLACGLHLSLSHDLYHELEQWELWAKLQAVGNVGGVNPLPLTAG